MSKQLQVIGSIEGSIKDGGWRAEGEIFGDADSLDWYKPVKSWLSVYAGGLMDPILAFSGHLVPQQWTKSIQSSRAPWRAFTAHQFLKEGRVQGIFYKETAIPANNHQITNMTYAHIVEEILGIPNQYGHCNLVKGVWPEGFMELNIDKANSVLAGEHEIKEGTMWSRLGEIAGIENYLMYVNRYNVFNYVPHPMFGVLPTPVFDLDSALLLEPLDIEPRNTESVGQIRLQGTTPAGQQISAVYPSIPGAGPTVALGGYKASSATGMQTVAQRKYLYENRDVGVTARLPGAIGCMVDLMDRITVTYDSLEDGVSWSSKPFWIEGVRISIFENFTSATELKLEAENSG